MDKLTPSFSSSAVFHHQKPPHQFIYIYCHLLPLCNPSLEIDTKFVEKQRENHSKKKKKTHQEIPLCSLPYSSSLIGNPQTSSLIVNQHQSMTSRHIHHDAIKQHPSLSISPKNSQTVDQPELNHFLPHSIYTALTQIQPPF